MVLTLNKILLYKNITAPINLIHLENVYDKYTDIQIMKAVKESDKVILTWSAHTKKTVIESHVNEVMEKLKSHNKKVKQLINLILAKI